MPWANFKNGHKIQEKAGARMRDPALLCILTGMLHWYAILQGCDRQMSYLLVQKVRASLINLPMQVA